MQIVVVLLLILLNSVLSMSEFAVVSSNRARLEERAGKGSKGAEVAVDLVENSNRFLSTVQVGITLVGILAGAFGGAAIADDLARVFREIPALASRAQSVALVVVVAATTYLTLVIGELVPKQLAIRHAEAIASKIAIPMRVLSLITLPLVAFLTVSSSFVLRLLGQRREPREDVSEEEVKLLLKRGEEAGVFRRSERRMVAGVFRLDDIRADAIMTPRVDVAWLDASSSVADTADILTTSHHSYFPVCDGQVDNLIGVVSARVIAIRALRSGDLNLRSLAEEAECVPESADAGDLVRRIAQTGKHFLVVVNEHGGVDGVVTAHDVSEAVLGDLETPEAQRLGEGAYRIAGGMPVEEAEATLEAEGLSVGAGKRYGTVAGFVMDALGRIPREGDTVVAAGYRFVVEGTDGRRVVWIRAERTAKDLE